MITEKQKKCLCYLITYIEKNSIPPTTNEIAEHFGKNPQSIINMLNSLQRKGFLKRGAGHRGIEIKLVFTGANK